MTAALLATQRLHPGLAGKAALVRAKEAAADSVRAQRYPSLSLNAGSSQSDGEDTGQSGTITARQPLWAFGRISSAIDYADQDRRVQEADLWSARRQLLEDTAISYANVQTARERLQLAEVNVLRHTDLQEQILRRQTGGLASAVDVRMAQTRLWQAQAQRENMLADLRAAESSLLALTQQAVDSTPPIPAAVLGLPEPAQLEEIVLAQSASLRQREALLALAQSDETRQARAGMPVLTLQSSRRYFSDKQTGRNTTGVNLQLEGNLDGLGFSLRGQVAAAAQRREAARQDIILARHDLQVRVRQLQEKRVSDQRLMAGYMQSIAVLEETLASFRRQYESGYKSWLDLLNIARELSDQQLQLVQVQADWRLQTLRLAAMSGRLDALAQLSSSPDVQP